MPMMGNPRYVEVWFDELRLNGFNQKGGAAALATANLKVADLGNIGLSGNMHTAGFGQVNQTLDQRFKDNLYSYGITTAFELGKFFPTNLGIRVPFYANFAQSLSTPEYDPYQFDIKAKEAVGIIKYLYGADSARAYQQEIRTINTTKGFNFTNVRVVPKTKAKRHVSTTRAILHLPMRITTFHIAILLHILMHAKPGWVYWGGVLRPKAWIFFPSRRPLNPHPNGLTS